MCASSVVSDYYMHQWPQTFPNRPNAVTEDPETRRLLREVMERLDRIDKRLGDLECHDEAKAAFIKRLEE